MPSNYPDGVSGSHPYFNPEGEPETAQAEIVEDETEDIQADIRRLAVAQALYKGIAPMVDTKGKDNLRSKVDDYFKRLYGATLALGAPVKSFDVTVDGMKVGTYSISPTEFVPSHDETVIDVVDSETLLLWAMERGFVKADMPKIEAYIEETGEIPDGMEPRTVHVPAKNAGIKSTTLCIDPAKVSNAIGSELVDPVLAFLEGSEW